MMIINGKSISQIKAEKEQTTEGPLLDIYEAIVNITEDLEAVKAENQSLKAEIQALKGGANNG